MIISGESGKANNGGQRAPWRRLAIRGSCQGRQFEETFITLYSYKLAKVDELMAVDPSENLNALSDAELQRRKDLMQLKFERNSVGKEHPDYVYDKVTDFGGLKEPAAGWDSDTDKEETPKAKPDQEIVKEDQYDDDEFSAPDDEDEDEDFW